MKIIRLFTAAAGLLLATALYADAKQIARAEISLQSELIRKGDVAKLKARFTERQRERVASANIKKAQKELKDHSLDDLVDKVMEGEYDGKKTIKIKMKNGRTLTTLVETDGQWYADTIWFR